MQLNAQYGIIKSKYVLKESKRCRVDLMLSMENESANCTHIYV